MLIIVTEILICLYCLTAILKYWRTYQSKKFKPVVFRNDIIYQYIEEAHQLVLNIVGVDPLIYPIKFQKELTKKIDVISPQIEKLRQKYVETIARDTEYGKTLQNYDFWLKARNSWVVRKKTKLDVVR